ncbi:MAG TPA: glutaredoxin family protein [Casimicrobiaceae bacterium]|jgi:glutaredoxin|nr:glutaredoxin family protein [Casimicrobiaceae bacterium]
MSVELTLLTRAYCHLCDDMRKALAEHLPGVAVLEIDVDAEPALEARWGTLVPVLLADGQEVCHYRLDPGALDAIVARSAGANSL